MPRPGSRLIPAGWAAHHAPVLDGTMTAHGVITRVSGDPVFNPDTGKSDPAPRTTVYDGPLRVQDQLLRRVEMVEFGGQQVTLGRIRVSLPLAVPVLIHDALAITATDSPALAGLVLRVMQIELSSIAWQTELTCEADSE